VEITLLRHGESAANLVGRWQGQGDTPLTEQGRRQVATVARRVATWAFDRVLSSDLGRASQSAAGLDLPVEVDPAWREADIGTWEGLTRGEVTARFPDELEALAAGQDVPLGGGERMSEFRFRIEEAFEKLLGGLDEEDHVLVVTHGGVVSGLAASVLGLGFERRRAIGRLTNCSLTTLRMGDEGRQVLRYNDAAHLGALTSWAADRWGAGETVISLVRHAQSEANLSGRWQGLGDGGLSDLGTGQVRGLAGWYGELDLLYASRLRRARDTAGGLRSAAGVLDEHPHLHEMAMGEWEGRTSAEIQAGWADLWERIYEEGEDLPLGASGETFREVAARMRAALAELAERHIGARFGVVSHGWAIRAYLGELLGLDHRTRQRLATPFNTSVSHLVVGEEGITVADFNVAPHLERPPLPDPPPKGEGIENS
jgi:broad specificity phosphatase PhoE